MGSLKMLVLGGNGFIGKNAVEYFSARSGYTVLAPRRVELNLLDTAAVAAYLQTERPDVVVLAAVNIRSVEENLQIYFNVERCRDYFGKLIVIGSGAEYDMRHYQPMMSESYFRTWIPADTYGLSKFVVSNDIEKSQSRAVNLRVLGIFGKHEDYRRRFISNNICRALCGFDITLSQNMRFDYLDVNDFNRILEYFVLRDSQQRNYNICTSRPLELLSLAQMIHEVHGDPGTAIRVKTEGMRSEYSADNAHFIDEYGPFEFTDIKASIRQLYDWYKADVDLDSFRNELSLAEGVS